jgi:lipid-A-disaccharide synthase-like uncharacterized protein
LPSTSSFLQPWLEPLLGRWLYVDSGLWTVVGFLGAAIFGSRFVLQWLQSEKEKKLVVPWYFWHLSFWGSVLNLLYFLHLDKAPLILGNCFLPFLYGRNILFLRAGGEKGRGRLVFAAVAVLVLIGFGISAFTGESGGISGAGRVTTEMDLVSKGLASHYQDHKTLPSGDTRSIVTALVDRGSLTTAKNISKDGEWLDPWGHPYRIFISGKSILIRCAGPNGVFDDGDNEKRDDILVESGVE